MSMPDPSGRRFNDTSLAETEAANAKKYAVPGSGQLPLTIEQACHMFCGYCLDGKYYCYRPKGEMHVSHCLLSERAFLAEAEKERAKRHDESLSWYPDLVREQGVQIRLSPPAPPTAPTGWVCPVCKCGVAPAVERCPCATAEATPIDDRFREARANGIAEGIQQCKGKIDVLLYEMLHGPTKRSDLWQACHELMARVKTLDADNIYPFSESVFTQRDKADAGTGIPFEFHPELFVSDTDDTDDTTDDGATPEGPDWDAGWEAGSERGLSNGYAACKAKVIDVIVDAIETDTRSIADLTSMSDHIWAQGILRSIREIQVNSAVRKRNKAESA